MKRNLMYLLIPVLLIVLSSCEKEPSNLFSSFENQSDESIIGTWVCEKTADTLYFIDDHIFNKSLNEGIKHTFEYTISKDSITIQYKGPNKIWVMATTHYYNLVGRELIIDFSNGCYGFYSEKETFLKQ